MPAGPPPAMQQVTWAGIVECTATTHLKELAD
jgi:hypothetical protein